MISIRVGTTVDPSSRHAASSGIAIANAVTANPDENAMMIPTWMIEQLGRQRRERELRERPRLRIEVPVPVNDDPTQRRPTSSGPIVIELRGL